MEQESIKEPDSNLLKVSSESPRCSLLEDDINSCRKMECTPEVDITEEVKIIEEMEQESIKEPDKKHISIQITLADLEKLAGVEEGLISAVYPNTEQHMAAGKKSCPLCPKEKFNPVYVHKLHRHLENVHWKVSVEFEGYRMCKCHLPCCPVKPNVAGEQVPTKIGCHYHCIICSATIYRRTDMVVHIKRHMKKGEKESIPALKTSHKVLKEAGTDVQVLPNYSTPQKTSSYFNPKMKLNRQLTVCALAVLAEERKSLECLDAFGATGIMGLQWAKHLGNSVKVTINDFNESSVIMIKENCQLNNMRVVMNSKEDGSGENNLPAIEVTNMDANVIMHSRAFDFIHLDPFGSSVNFLDAAFRNVRNLGIVSITSTDISSLYSKAQQVAQRHYGCNIVRTEYYKELAARMVVAAVARAAARCNKGIEVLFAVALEHFVLTEVRVLRGNSYADDTVKKIRYLIHCQWCEERVFKKEGSMIEENPYRHLPCDCHSSMTGKTAFELGPLWSGSLFSSGFLRRMLFQADEYDFDDIQALLKTLIYEAECTTLTQRPSILAFLNQRPSTKQGKRKSPEMSPDESKREKRESNAEHPAFYYNVHRHSIKGMNMPKLNKFLHHLSEAGYRVSRTHFDPMGVRTNAPLMQFKSILGKFSTTGSQSEGSLQTSENSQAGTEAPDTMMGLSPQEDWTPSWYRA